jgi:hypothetical protein
VGFFSRGVYSGNLQLSEQTRPPLPLLERRGFIFISPPFKEETKRRSKKTGYSPVFSY